MRAIEEKSIKKTIVDIACCDIVHLYIRHVSILLFVVTKYFCPKLSSSLHMGGKRGRGASIVYTTRNVRR